MIEIERFTLDNGLNVIVNQDKTTPLAAFNLLYKVGSRNEDPEKTGFAHLFEHLMFEGSVNIPDFDKPLQEVGGENNAFTSDDITNYYITLPANNLETAFWLESDRMLSLNFSEHSLNVQKNVVIEEYKQRYLNQPYGDVYLLLRPLAYKVHPYLWSTIGKDISHIEKATLDDVKNFFFSYYAPNNAILTISGNVDLQKVMDLSEKWFGNIEKRQIINNQILTEPEQLSPRILEVERDVPFNAIYKAYHTCARGDAGFHTIDLISDILANGRSARLYQELVKKRKLFSSIDCYVSGELDPGLLCISGKLLPGISMQTANSTIEEEIAKLQTLQVSDYELDKVKNKFESTQVFSETNTLNKAMNLAFSELLGDAADVNHEIDKYRAVTKEMIISGSKSVLSLHNCSTLFYYSKNQPKE